MLISEIKRVIEQVSRDKGIDRHVLIKALEEALKSAARKKYGPKVDIEVQYSEETGELEVFQFKEVAEEVEEPMLQISLQEGRRLDPDCEVGDSLGTKMDTATFGRIAAQSAKQVIIQKLKDAEKDAVYTSYSERRGEIINGIVQRIDRGDIIVNLGQTEGVLPIREQVPKESYRRGDRIRALILEVLHESRGPQVVLSRTHPSFLITLFRTEVPEISEGIVSIMGASREPGVRAKIAVASSNSDIDPVGACVGMKGSRVQNVVQELRGEKIDIIPWHIDAAKFVCSSLAPAEISRVIIDEDNRSMEVIVPDEFLSIAIGKKGQNVRLASKLTGWHLDVKSESSYNQAMQSGYNSLMALPGVGISLADALYEKGFYSADEIAKASREDLLQIRGVDETMADSLIEAAQTAAEQAAAAEPEAEPGAEASQPAEQGNAGDEAGDRPAAAPRMGRSRTGRSKRPERWMRRGMGSNVKGEGESCRKFGSTNWPES
jgi:transcription termination/antitermination protein NusA